MPRLAPVMLPFCLVLSACVGGGGTGPAMTTSSSGNPQADACRGAIAAAAGRPMGDVIVYRSASTATGGTALAAVAGSRGPWQCQTGADGQVAGVAPLAG